MTPPNLYSGDGNMPPQQPRPPQPAQERVPPPSPRDSSPNLRSRNGHHAPRLRHSGKDGLPTVHSVSDDDEVDHGHPKRTLGTKKGQKGDPKPVTVLLFETIRRLVLRHRILLACLAFILYLDHVIHFKRRYLGYFGVHPMDGGSLGIKWDRSLLKKVIDQTYERKRRELADMKIELPIPHRTETTQLLQINTNAALREFLIRREGRLRHLIEMEDVANTFQHGCIPPKSQGNRRLLLMRHQVEGPRTMGGIPKNLLLPHMASWPKPRPNQPSQQLGAVTFDESDMRHLIEDFYVSILPTYDSMRDSDDRTRVWAICALHFYGGVFLGKEATSRPAFTKKLLEETLAGLFSDRPECVSPKGFALFHRTNNNTDVFMMGITPRNPHLRCVLNALENSANPERLSQILSTLFLDISWKTSQTFKQLNGDDKSLTWERLSSGCYYGQSPASNECCTGLTVESHQDVPDAAGLSMDGKGSQLYVRGINLDSSDIKKESAILVPATVDIGEREGTEVPLKNQKVSLERIMNEERSAPGWMCCRCLKTPLYGSIAKCSAVCNSGFEKLMCYAPDTPERTEVVVEVTIGMRQLKPGERRIPRIVHQTWFEELSPDRYPQLVRLQESWKNSGWDYRFYTDQQARDYIVKHFPLRFVDAFDALIPGAYKADLFRYLVLMREGGVYADVDIMLDATLDTFVDPSLSFFVPRDVVGEYADESFCLWNGIIGSAPGHPFMIRAVERLVGLILQRADLFDMEQDVCRRVGRSMENWKVRAEPLLLASGPCALGVAVNDVLQRPSLAKFDIGWIAADEIKYGRGEVAEHGDALIMVGDKYDLGSFRISDPERSLVLASTDLPGISKQARDVGNPTRSEIMHKHTRKTQGAHYSEAAQGEYVWGAHNVYHDDYVNNEEIKFDVVYT